MKRKKNGAKLENCFGWIKNDQVTSAIGAWGGVTVGTNHLQAGTRATKQRGGDESLYGGYLPYIETLSFTHLKCVQGKVRK